MNYKTFWNGISIRLVTRHGNWKLLSTSKMGLPKCGQLAKMSVLMWKIRWGIRCPDLCVLCNCSDESPSHLLFNYSYNRSLLLSFTKRSDECLWKVMNAPIPSIEDIRIGDLIEGFNWLTKGIPTWVYIGMCYQLYVGSHGRKETVNW